MIGSAAGAATQSQFYGAPTLSIAEMVVGKRPQEKGGSYLICK